MRTRRPISINNSLSHGICNCNCQLCGVNKPNYKGPKEFQSKEITERLIQSVRDAAEEGLQIRYIANAGDGEPTLNPEFPQRMDMFGDMIRKWNVPGFPAPEVSVVTNGVRLLVPGILEAISRNPITLIVSFPTPDPESYGQVMAGDASRGADMLSRVTAGIEKAFQLLADKRLNRLQFHISPPEREVVRRDFARTVDFITSRARQAGVEKVELVLFPATSNRSGLIRNRIKGVDMYPDFFRRYNGRVFNGVRVEMKLSYKRFFPRFSEFFDLLINFRHPCTWNSQLFITASGHSTCCNDQAVRNPLGDLRHQSLVQLIERKEDYLPGRMCAGCDQSPRTMRGSFLAWLFGRLSLLRLTVSLAAVALSRHPEAPANAPALPALVEAEDHRPL